MTEGAPIDVTRFWKEGSGKPASTLLHPEFKALLTANGEVDVIDVGCGTGRIIEELPLQVRVTGIDINGDSIADARAAHPGVTFVQANAEHIPFSDQSFDGAILLGTLGAMDLQTRGGVLTETSRTLKPSGVIYIAEFAYIQDPEARTSKGTFWKDVYDEDEVTTGERGTVLVRDANNVPIFAAHHFTPYELLALMESQGFSKLELRDAQVVSQVSGQQRKTLNTWGFKNG